MGRSRRADGDHAEYSPKALGVTPHELKDPDTGIRTGGLPAPLPPGFGKVTDPVEKIKFTLAAYNAGIGHIYDAQRLAEKYGKIHMFGMTPVLNISG